MLMKEAIAIIMEQEGLTRTELAKELGLTPGMLSHYTKSDHYPRLGVATTIYVKYRLQVEPYTKSALSLEVQRIDDANR